MMMGKLNRLSEENKELFIKVYNEIRCNSRFEECENYIQHGNTTVKAHVVRVTLLALNICEKFNMDVNKEALVKGALLHDYYLYDWHEKKLSDFHGLKHPRRALRQALKEFKLNEIEEDIIMNHMFPLTSAPPRSKEARLLCLADKLCAWGETVDGRIR